MPTVPMISPNGEIGDVPDEQVQAALSAGFKRGYDMVSSDGKQRGVVPESGLHDALKAGFKRPATLADTVSSANYQQANPGGKIKLLSQMHPELSVADKAQLVFQGKMPASQSGNFSDSLIPQDAQIRGPESLTDKAIRYAKTALIHGPEMVGQIIGGVAGSTGGPAGAVGGAALGAAGGRSFSNLVRSASPSIDVFARNAGMEPLPETSGEAATQIATAGAIGALSEATAQGAGALLGKPGAKLLQKSSEKQYGRLLYPTKQWAKADTQRIAPELAERRITTTSREALQERATAEANQLRPQVEAAYSALPADEIPAAKQQALDALDSLKQRYMVKGVTGTTEREVASPLVDAAGQPMTTTVSTSLPAEVAGNPSAIHQIDAIRKIVSEVDASPQSLRRLKQIFDESVADASGYSGADITTAYTVKAQKAAADSIRDVLHQQFPDVAALDKEMSFWLRVKGVISATNQRLEGQQGSLQRLAGYIGAGAGGAEGYREHGTSGAVVGGLLGGAAGKVVIAALRSPAWMSVSAATKSRIADALASGQVGKAALWGYRAVGSSTQTAIK
ncbi:MAG: hypothetical protein ACE14M_05115 [Terriglobales bacterium]